LILTRAKNSIAKQIIKEKISILEISAYLSEISSSLESDMTSKLDKYGIKLINFFVKSINTPEDDPAVVKLKDALAKRAEMDIVGFNYQQERSYDTLETAAGNPSSGQSDLMGAGIGLGMGFGMGGSMGGAMGQMAQGIQLGGHHCSECNSVIQPGAKFCSSCGKSNGAKESKDEKTKGVVCDKCGTEAPQGSNFCPKCGDPFICCPKCGTDNPEGGLKCIECSEPMPQTCKKCGERITGNYIFCPKCGSQLVKKCPKCNAELKPEMMFCPECGKPSPSRES
jgi:membrane protease subunit (stomatin/prohibitin family)